MEKTTKKISGRHLLRLAAEAGVALNTAKRWLDGEPVHHLTATALELASDRLDDEPQLEKEKAK